MSNRVYLRSFSGPFDAGEGSSALQNQVSLEEKPAVAKRNSKRKGKGLSEDEPVEVTANVSDISGGKRTTRQVKQSSKDSVDIGISQSATEQELIVETTEMEGA